MSVRLTPELASHTSQPASQASQPARPPNQPGIPASHASQPARPPSQPGLPTRQDFQPASQASQPASPTCQPGLPASLPAKPQSHPGLRASQPGKSRQEKVFARNWNYLSALLLHSSFFLAHPHTALFIKCLFIKSNKKTASLVDMSRLIRCVFSVRSVRLTAEQSVNLFGIRR